VITQIDEALRELVREAVGSSDVEVVFDAPTKDWAARRNAPTVDLYLYDLREDMRRRAHGVVEPRDEQGHVQARYKPPRHFRLSYLITAWTQRPEDEHRLLDAVLGHLVGFDALPAHVLGATLADAGARVPLSVGLPPPEDRGFADVWTALGGELKPSIDAVVDAPLLAGAPQPVGKPVEEGLHVDLTDTRGGAADQGRRQHPAPAPRPPTTAPTTPTARPARARTRRSS